jgi:hypothetical protein
MEHLTIMLQLTRLIPEAKGTKCNVELEPVEHTKHSSILRVPFKTDDGKDLRQWVSRFDIYPYLERYAQVCQLGIFLVLITHHELDATPRTNSYRGDFRILRSRFLTYWRENQTWLSAIILTAI